jgi:hypothetical protein
MTGFNPLSDLSVAGAGGWGAGGFGTGGWGAGGLGAGLGAGLGTGLGAGLGAGLFDGNPHSFLAEFQTNPAGQFIFTVPL